jgi:hypothetical protein
MREFQVAAGLRDFLAPAAPEVLDESGEQPNYIGEQEFYASHVKQGGAVMVVRTPEQESASRAARILRDHHAHLPGSKEAPAVRRID